MHQYQSIRKRAAGILSVLNPRPGSSHIAEPGLGGVREGLQKWSSQLSCLIPPQQAILNKLSLSLKCPVLPTFITLFSVLAYISWTHTFSSVDYLHLSLQVLVVYLSSVWVVASPIDALRTHGTQHCFHSPPPPSKKTECSRYAHSKGLANLCKVGKKIRSVDQNFAVYIIYSCLHQKTGGLVSVKVMGQPIIIVNAISILHELDKKGALYSDRPRLEMGGELLGYSETLVLLPYGDRFRTYRKNIARFLGGTAQVKEWYPLIERATHLFLRSMMKRPLDLMIHLRK